MGATYINPDIIAQEQFGDWNAPNAVRQAADVADQLRDQAMRARHDLAYETVFSTDRRVEELRRAKQIGYFIRFFFVATQAPQINIERVRRRVREGGHDVPEDRIVARYHRSLERARAALQIVGRAYIIDNSRTDADYTLMFRSVDGVVARTYVDDTSMPTWARELAESLPPPSTSSPDVP